MSSLLQVVQVILDTVFGLFACALLLRFWMQLIRIRPPQQVAHFVYQLSDWVVKPLRRVIPGVSGVDWASLIATYLLAVLSAAISFWLLLDFVPATVLLVGIYTLLHWIILGWTATLFLEVIFSWVNPYAPLAPFVRALNAPLLDPIRKMIPAPGGLDLSPMVLLLLLQVAGRLIPG